MRHLGEALDTVRKSEYARLAGRDRRYIKGQKYTLLSRKENLTLDGKKALKTLLSANKRLNTAYVLKESFGQLWSYEREGWARRFFENWRASLKWQRSNPTRSSPQMIDRHWDGIAAYCGPENKVSLGFVEGLNNKIRVIQRRAYGLRNEDYLRLKILTCMLPAPYFIGIWDTVSSVGWIENPLRLPYSANNPDIQIGRHAIAIDERRAFFRTNLWHPTPTGGPKDVNQVWFSGVHCDVGGGYPEAKSGLSKIALKWMLQEAIAAGLFVNSSKMNEVLGVGGSGYVVPNPLADLHNSLTPAWWAAEFIPKRHFNSNTKKDERRMNLFRRRTIPSGALVHRSVLERGETYWKNRLPSNYVPVD